MKKFLIVLNDFNNCGSRETVQTRKILNGNYGISNGSMREDNFTHPKSINEQEVRSISGVNASCNS
jgi:hypothetical protein